MNKICEGFGVKYPIVAGGMVWCSGWRLAAAVCKAGGIGLIGAGSMTPEVLREHITKIKDACKSQEKGTWGVNIPLMKAGVEEIIEVVKEELPPVVFTSAGSPKKYTKIFQELGIKVAHVVSGSKFAIKCVEAGVDAIVAEGFEAGGHNGREETTTMTLIPQVADALKKAGADTPLIAAGGIASGRAMAAAFALGAVGVQVGTAFALAEESGACKEFKEYCTKLQEGDTMLVLKKLSPTRLVKNAFFDRIMEAENRGASAEELLEIIGAGRPKLGMFDGNLTEGELEIGQIVSQIKEIKTAEHIINDMISEFNTINLEKFA